MPDKNFLVEAMLKFKHDNKALTQASSQTKGMQKKVKALRAEIKLLGAQAVAQFDKIALGMVSMGKKAMLAGGLILGALGAIFYKASKQGAMLESYRVTLQQLYGDAGEAKGALEWIMGMQVKTPYTPEELLGALKPLKVFGMDAEKWLPAIGDMASTMGKDITDAATGVAKAFSAGQAGADALRESYGVTMTNLVKISGYTEKELRTDMEKYRDALYQFITDPKFKGGMARYAKTFKGVLSSIKGGFQTFMMFLGEAVNKVMKEDFAKIVNWIVKVYESGKLKEWAERVAEGFKLIWQGLKKAGAIIWKFIKPFVEFFRKHPDMLKFAVAGIAVSGALLLVGGGISFFTGKLWQMGRGLISGIGHLRKFGGTLTALFTKTKAAGGISGLLGGLAGKGGIAGKIGGLFAGGGAAAGGGIMAALGPAIPIIGGIVAALALLATAWKKNFAGIREAAAKAIKPLLDIVRAIFGVGKKANILKTIVAVLKAAWLGLAKVVAPVFKLVFTVIGAVFRILKAVLMPIIMVLQKVFAALGLGGKGAVAGITGAFDVLAKVIGGIADAIGWVVDIIAKGIEWTIGLVFKGVKEMVKGTSVVGKVLRVIFWPLTLIILAIKNIIEGVQKLGAIIGAVFGGMGRQFKNVQDQAKNVKEELKELHDKQKDGIELTEEETARVEELNQEYADLQQQYAALRGEWEKYADQREAWRKIRVDAMVTWELIKTRWHKTMDPVKLEWQRFWKATLPEGWDAMKRGFTKTFGTIKRRWQEFVASIAEIFAPLINIWNKFFDPFIKKFEEIQAKIGATPDWFKRLLGFTKQEIGEAKMLATWSAAQKEARKMGKAKADADAAAAAAEDKDKEKPPADTLAAGAGAGAGGGGPQINYWTTHNHWERGSVMINVTGDPAALKKALIEVFGQEALATS